VFDWITTVPRTEGTEVPGQSCYSTKKTDQDPAKLQVTSIINRHDDYRCDRRLIEPKDRHKLGLELGTRMPSDRCCHQKDKEASVK